MLIKKFLGFAGPSYLGGLFTGVLRNGWYLIDSIILIWLMYDVCDWACNEECPAGYFKDATYGDTICIGDNWSGVYCSLCGVDTGDWVMDPCSSLDDSSNILSVQL